MQRPIGNLRIYSEKSSNNYTRSRLRFVLAISYSGHIHKSCNGVEWRSTWLLGKAVVVLYKGAGTIYKYGSNMELSVLRYHCFGFFDVVLLNQAT